MKPMMWKEASKAFDKAEDALQIAAHDLKGDFILAAVNRAYYACYFA